MIETKNFFKMINKIRKETNKCLNPRKHKELNEIKKTM
jgi:hypothetical protein